MSTAQSQASDQFSHSNLLKVAEFAKYIADNWTPETNLRLISLGYWEGEINFSFESPLGQFEASLDLSQEYPEIGMSYVNVYGTIVDTISLRYIAGNY